MPIDPTSPGGYGSYFGLIGPNEEEERRKKLMELGVRGPLTLPPVDAGEPNAPMVAAPQVPRFAGGLGINDMRNAGLGMQMGMGGPPTGAGGLFGMLAPAVRNALPTPPNAAPRGEMVGPQMPDLGGFMGPMQPPAQQVAGAAQQWNPVVSGPSGTMQYGYSKGPNDADWTQAAPKWTGGMPGSGFGDVTGAIGIPPKKQGAEAIQDVFNQAFDRMNTIPGTSRQNSLDSPHAQQAMKFAQMAIAPHLEQMQTDARIKEAELKHKLDNSPESMAQKLAMAAYGTTMGQEGGTPEKANAAALLAYRDALKLGKELHGSAAPTSPASPGMAGVPGLGQGAGWKGVEDKAAGRGSETELSEWKKANLDQLPATMGVSRPGKGLPPVMGSLKGNLDQNWGLNMLARASDLAAKDPKAAEALIAEIGDSSPQAKKALLQAAAVNKFGAMDQDAFYQALVAKKGGKGGLGLGDFPIDLKTGSGEPFSFRAPEGGSMLSRGWEAATAPGGFPYPEILTEQGERLPVNISPAVAGRLGKTKDQIKAESTRLMPLADMILKAYAVKR